MFEIDNEKDLHVSKYHTHEEGQAHLLVGCLASQHLTSVSQGHMCSDDCRRCHTEIEAAD